MVAGQVNVWRMIGLFCFQFYWGTIDQTDMLKVYNVMISYLYTLWHDYWNQLQYPCLENLTDGGAWKAVAHGIAKSRTWLSDFPFTFHFHALEKEMATHSIVLAWRIPGTGEPGGLPSMGLHRVGHNWSNLAAAAAANTFINWHTLIFLFVCITVGHDWATEQQS